MIIKLDVNDKIREINIEPYESLLDVLRERLGLSGARMGCSGGGCGTCTVLLNDRPVYSCMVFAAHADGKKVITVEGLARNGKLHSLQEAFMEYGAVQCGYCKPGQIMAAKALLDRNNDPTEAEVKEAIAGNLCRCTGYVKIVKAIQGAAVIIRKCEVNG